MPRQVVTISALQEPLLAEHRLLRAEGVRAFLDLDSEEAHESLLGTKHV
jgi:hypothetical protein